MQDLIITSYKLITNVSVTIDSTVTSVRNTGETGDIYGWPHNNDAVSLSELHDRLTYISPAYKNRTKNS